MVSGQSAIELLQIEEAAAWLDYFDATRGKVGKTYEEAEKSAGTTLDERLEVINRRRSKLELVTEAV
jgi:hypothetical protein